MGKVYLVRLRGTDELYAMKVLSKEEMVKKNKVQRVMTEREILATSNHPFIVTLHWCWTSTKHIYFVMDYCAGGEFFRVLQRTPNKCLPESAARFYAAEVLIALEYLHIQGVIYRDLKPENLLLHETGHIKLTDFDLSKGSAKPAVAQVVREMFGGDIKKVSSVPDLVTNSFVGTAEYIAPEVITGFGHSSSVDWWTFGILIYEMLCGRAPFQGTNRDEIFKKIMDEKVRFPEGLNVSKEAKKLVRALLNPDAKKRLGAEHGAADIKAHDFFKGVHWALVADTKPPLVPPPPKDFEKNNSQTHMSEEHATSMDHATPVVAVDTADPFAAFENVSKPEAPTQQQIEQHEAKNDENEAHDD